MKAKDLQAREIYKLICPDGYHYIFICEESGTLKHGCSIKVKSKEWCTKTSDYRINYRSQVVLATEAEVFWWKSCYHAGRYVEKPTEEKYFKWF